MELARNLPYISDSQTVAVRALQVIHILFHEFFSNNLPLFRKIMAYNRGINWHQSLINKDKE